MVRWIAKNQETQLLSEFNLTKIPFIHLNHNYRVWDRDNCGYILAHSAFNSMLVINNALNESNEIDIENMIKKRMGQSDFIEQLTNAESIQQYLRKFECDLFTKNNNQHNKAPTITQSSIPSSIATNRNSIHQELHTDHTTNSTQIVTSEDTKSSNVVDHQQSQEIQPEHTEHTTISQPTQTHQQPPLPQSKQKTSNSLSTITNVTIQTMSPNNVPVDNNNMTLSQDNAMPEHLPSPTSPTTDTFDTDNNDNDNNINAANLQQHNIMNKEKRYSVLDHGTPHITQSNAQIISAAQPQTQNNKNTNQSMNTFHADSTGPVSNIPSIEMQNIHTTHNNNNTTMQFRCPSPPRPPPPEFRSKSASDDSDSSGSMLRQLSQFTGREMNSYISNNNNRIGMFANAVNNHNFNDNHNPHNTTSGMIYYFYFYNFFNIVLK